MKQSVIIKSSKSGMTIVLDDQVPFDTIIAEIAEKFNENAKFWGSVQMTLSIEGRVLSPAEELEVINTISDNSQVEILCLLDNDAERVSRCERALNDKLMELSGRTGQFYRGALLRGETIDSEASIVIVGDVHKGARINAKGNVIILGELFGNVHAGISGDENAVIVALNMIPTQLKIGDYSYDLDDKKNKIKRGPSLACIYNKTILVKPMKKSFFEMINSI